jgi:hypothetical protein
MWPVEIAGEVWQVHASAAGWWHYRLVHDADDGRRLLLRDIGQEELYDEDGDEPPEELPRWEDWDAEEADVADVWFDGGVEVLEEATPDASSRWAIKGEWGAATLWSMVAGQPTDGRLQPQVWAAALEFRRWLRAIQFSRAPDLPRIEEIRVGRIDLCADLIIGRRFDLAKDTEGFRGDAVRRIAREQRRVVLEDVPGTIGTPEGIEHHHSLSRFSGWSFGRSPMMVRIYDKTIEIAGSSGAVWFHELWETGGCAPAGVVFGPRHEKGETCVWRAEAQIRRDAARFWGIPRLSTAAVHSNLAQVWRSVFQKWITLRKIDPSAPKKRTSRLPMDPRWQAIIAAWGDGMPRRYGRRIPDRDRARTARAAAGAVASYAAAIGAAEPVDALAELALDPDAAERFGEVAGERTAQQVLRRALEHPGLARAIGSAILEVAEMGAVDLHDTCRDLAVRLEGPLGEVFRRRLNRIRRRQGLDIAAGNHQNQRSPQR